MWDLTGPSDTWRGQLEALYRQQPVFAVVSGIGAGEWRPVHRFCEDFELPCLLPTTAIPVVSDSDFYSLYFTEGLVLEAKALAEYLGTPDPQTGPVRILQVYRDDEIGEAASFSFRQALLSRRVSGVAERRIARSEKVDKAFWHALARQWSADILVIWLPAADLAEAAALVEAADPPATIVLSSSLVPDYQSLVARELWDRVLFVHPFALPKDSKQKTSIVTRWLQGQGVDITHERVQLNAYFAARVLGDALMHMVGNFNRDYLIEKIQHRVSGTVTPSLYPVVSLAPGQHFLSKGCYIVKPLETAEGGLVAVSAWIVP